MKRRFMQALVNEKLMNYEEFIEYISRQVMQLYAEEYEITLEKIQKNNATEFDSLIVRKLNSNIAPNIYLNLLYENYQKGASIPEILTIIHQNVMNIPEDILVSANEGICKRFLSSFYEIRDFVVFRIINYEKNVELLEQVPHQRFLDLALTYHCLVHNNDTGIGTVRITNQHMKQWNIGLAELEEVAITNTARIFPVLIRRMKDVIEAMIRCDGEDYGIMDHQLPQTENEKDQSFENRAYVMSNTQGINGASTILYQGVLSELSKQRSSDFYILPSSIHEVIILPASNDFDVKSLVKMVQEVNREQVASEEVLSNHIYYYSTEKGLQLLNE